MWLSIGFSCFIVTISGFILLFLEIGYSSIQSMHVYLKTECGDYVRYASIAHYIRNALLISLGLCGIVLQFQRRNRIYKEEQRQLRAAARKGKEGGNVDGHSH